MRAGRTSLLLLGLAASVAHGQSAWTGGAGTNQWCTPGNWDPAQLPTGNVTIQSAQQRITTLGCTPSIASMTASAPLLIAGEFRFSGVLECADLQIATGTAPVGPLTTGTASISIVGMGEWNTGQLRNHALVVEPGASLFMPTFAGVRELREGMITNNGSVQQSGGLTLIGGSATQVVNSGQWVFASGNISIRRSTAGDLGLFTNAETGVVRTDHTNNSPVYLELPFVNHGNLSAERGGITFRSGGAGRHGNGSRVLADAGQLIEFAATQTFDDVFVSGDGTILLSALALVDGMLVVQCDPTGLLGAFRMQGLGASLSLGSNGAVTNRGYFDWLGGTIDGIAYPKHVINEGTLRVASNASRLSQVLFENHAVVRIEKGGGSLNFLDSRLVNHATGVVAWASGSLFRSGVTNAGLVNQGTITKSTTSQARLGIAYHAELGSVLHVQAGELVLESPENQFSGGSLRTDPGATLRLIGAATVNAGPPTIVEGHGLFRLNDNAIITLTPGSTLSNQSDNMSLRGRVLGGGALNNSGTIAMDACGLGPAGGTSSDATIVRNLPGATVSTITAPSAVGCTLVNESGATLGLENSIGLNMAPGARISNAGEMRLVGSAGVTAYPGTPTGAIENAGRIFKTGVGASTVNALIDNLGTVTVAGGQLAFSGPVANFRNDTQGRLVLTGGTWNVSAGATLSFNGRAVRVLEAATRMTLAGSCPDCQGIAEIKDMSLFEPFSIINPDSDMAVQQSGELRLRGTLGARPGRKLDVRDRATLSGDGRSDRPTELSGEATISPGQSPGVLSLASITMLGGNLLTEVAGYDGPGAAAGHDLLAATGNAQLGGTLRVRFIDGFTPSPGDAFTILTAATVTGEFAQIIGETGERIAVDYLPGAVVLRVIACDADVNCDGVPDQGDVACIVLAVAGDTGCFCQVDPDFNRDGVPDQGDVADVILVVAGAPCP